MIHATPFLPGLSAIAGEPLTATSDAGRQSSDSSLVVLREIAARLGLARPIPDDRDQARVVTATPTW
jgi:hypothetical protein